MVIFDGDGCGESMSMSIDAIEQLSHCSEDRWGSVWERLSITPQPVVRGSLHFTLSPSTLSVCALHFVYPVSVRMGVLDSCVTNFMEQSNEYTYCVGIHD